MPSVVLQPAGSAAAAGHYAMTIDPPAEMTPERLDALTAPQRRELEALYPGAPMRVPLWGVTEHQRPKWERIQS